jgi:hypothetical protein
MDKSQENGNGANEPTTSDEKIAALTKALKMVIARLASLEEQFYPQLYEEVTFENGMIDLESLSPATKAKKEQEQTEQKESNKNEANGNAEKSGTKQNEAVGDEDEESGAEEGDEGDFDDEVGWPVSTSSNCSFGRGCCVRRSTS